MGSLELHSKTYWLFKLYFCLEISHLWQFLHSFWENFHFQCSTTSTTNLQVRKNAKTLNVFALMPWKVELNKARRIFQNYNFPTLSGCSSKTTKAINLIFAYFSSACPNLVVRTFLLNLKRTNFSKIGVVIYALKLATNKQIVL